MKCRKCNFWSPVAFLKCPICDAPPNKSYLVPLFKNIFSWVRDRRICLISKRQHIDLNLSRHPLMLSQYSFHRIWWVYRLFDVIPVGVVQDPTAVFTFNPMPEQKPPARDATTSSGGMN